MIRHIILNLHLSILAPSIYNSASNVSHCTLGLVWRPEVHPLTIEAVYSAVRGMGGVQAATEHTLMIAPLPLSNIWGSNMWDIRVTAEMLIFTICHTLSCGMRAKYCGWS
jgi:hypothetical protein